MARIKSDKAGTIKLKTPGLLKRREKEILDTWMKNQIANITLRLDLISKGNLETQSKIWRILKPRSINQL